MSGFVTLNAYSKIHLDAGKYSDYVRNELSRLCFAAILKKRKIGIAMNDIRFSRAVCGPHLL